MTQDPHSLSTLKDLVAFDTTSAKSNLAMIDHLADRLSGLGFDIRMTRNAEGSKANLFATIGPSNGSGPPSGGIVLSGHTDVVPAAAEDWTTPPFAASVRDERVYGRGTADMKGFIACCLAAAPHFAQARLTKPVHFAFSYDEEVGCLGVRSLLADLKTANIRPALCVVGEPTEMNVIIGHKGKKSVTCTVLGKEGHSAMNHLGVNAVEIAADLVSRIRALQRQIKTDGPFEDGYDPPYTTLHTGTIRGGLALNIIPRDCTFEFEIRNLPGHDPETVMRELRAYAQELVVDMLAVDPATGILFNEYNTTAGLSSGPDDEATQLACQLSGHNHTQKVSFTTEAGLFAVHGIPAVVCGPGSIAQAHRPDEFIALEQLVRCETFLNGLLERVSGG
jgi:acetylornithine deacetylase